MEELFAETNYDASETPLSVEIRIGLRRASARLLRALLEQGYTSKGLLQCLEGVSKDMFPEVRREVEDVQRPPDSENQLE